MQSVRRKIASAIKATILFLLGLQLVFPFALPIRVSAQHEPVTEKRESRLAEDRNRKLPDGTGVGADRAVAGDDLLIAGRSSLIFTPRARAIWSQAVVDPRGPGLAAGAESLVLLASNDDTAIFGVRCITSSSPFFPRRQ